MLQCRAVLRSSPAERNSLPLELAAWLREVVVLWCVGCLWPFQMLRRTWSRDPGDPSKVPVVLVPGYLESETLMASLRRALQQRGRPYATYKYEPLLGPGEDQAIRLLQFVRSIRGPAKAGPVDLIGHSFGGLLIRRLVQLSEPGEVGKMVLLATPHSGSEIAVFALGPAGRDLRPGSAFLQSLHEPPMPPGPVLDLRASCDAMIQPRGAAILDDGSERLEGAWGHNSMLMAKETIQRVLRFLD